MSESMEMKTCPKCGSPATELIDVDTGMRTILATSGIKDLPAQVCSACYNGLTNQVSQGVKLRIEQQAKEKNRHMVWKSRVNLIKHARQMMAQKAYSEAAVSYEKYIRVLEISYDLKPGMLTPDVFGKSSRSKELTIIATTYWDLFRIYDTNPKYRDRMSLSARKLSEFLSFSPIHPDVIKKAQEFLGHAKNPDVVREFLRLCKAGTGRCFIATAAFADANHPVVQQLRQFRDAYLLPYGPGRMFIKVYYWISPHLAKTLDTSPPLRRVTQIGLSALAKSLPEKPLVHSSRPE
jgi:hypothetical protein